MSHDLIITIMASTAVAMAVLAVSLIAMRLLGISSRYALLHDWALPAAAVVAVLATVSSLWLSEVANFVPCRLCWYQRIAMYPLAIILPIAAVRRDIPVRIYALPIAVIGALIAVFHHIEQRTPTNELLSCSADGTSCTTRWVDEFSGMVSIPTMAFAGFLLIVGLLLVSGRSSSAGS